MKCDTVLESHGKCSALFFLFSRGEGVLVCVLRRGVSGAVCLRWSVPLTSCHYLPRRHGCKSARRGTDVQLVGFGRHRPRVLIKWSGKPLAAAVEAAPMRKSCPEYWVGSIPASLLVHRDLIPGKPCNNIDKDLIKTFLWCLFKHDSMLCTLFVTSLATENGGSLVFVFCTFYDYFPKAFHWY